MSTLDELFKRLQANDLTVSASKCQFGVSAIDFLGYRVDSTGIKPLQKRCNQDTQEPFLHELPATITIWLLSNNFCSEIKLLRQKKKKANLWSMPLPFLSFINNLMYLICGIYCIHEVSYSTDNKLIILADKDQTDCLMECTNIFHFSFCWTRF